VKTVHQAAGSIVSIHEVPRTRNMEPSPWLPPRLLGCGLKHPACQTGKWEGLEPDLAEASQGRKEEPFAAEEGGEDFSLEIGADGDPLSGTDIIFRGPSARREVFDPPKSIMPQGFLLRRKS
jgi:hypothetical protein